MGHQAKDQQQRRLRNLSRIYYKQTALVKKEILCNKTKIIRVHIRTSMVTVALFLFRTRTRTDEIYMLVLAINHSCAQNITLPSLVRKKFSRYLTSTITIVMKFMLDQARLEHNIKTVLHYVVIHLRSFLAHPEHIGNIRRIPMKADHHIEIMYQIRI